MTYKQRYCAISATCLDVAVFVLGCILAFAAVEFMVIFSTSTLSGPVDREVSHWHSSQATEANHEHHREPIGQLPSHP
jgi:hypothetical protein